MAACHTVGFLSWVEGEAYPGTVGGAAEAVWWHYWCCEMVWQEEGPGSC